MQLQIFFLYKTLNKQTNIFNKMTQSATYDTIATLRREDEKMTNAMQFIVPVSHGRGLWAPGTYMDTGEAPISEKVTYSQMLTGQNVVPQVQITDEDIQKVRDKTWMATLYDFDNWVGEYLKPNQNPANKALLDKIYPEWLDRQKQVVENYHDMKKRVETLKITGPKNREDLFLFYRMGYPTASEMGQNSEFAAYTQRNDGPALGRRGQNQIPISLEQDQMNFQRGIFNLNRREMTTKALAGYDHSVFHLPEAQAWQAGNKPYGTYPVPQWNSFQSPAPQPYPQ
jgi:hypothetical protein